MLKIFSINWIEPLYRPLVNIMTGEIISVEIYSRLRHPEVGFINQDDFMSTFNQTGLLELLYSEKLDLALEEIQKNDVNIKVLIDAEFSLFQNDISVLTESICYKHKYSSKNITINLINNAGSDMSETIILNLNKMKEIGVSFSISAFDFPALGLNNHRDIPFDMVEIDQGLIQDVLKNFKSREIVRALINISKTFELKCIASGVNDAVTLGLLKEMGVFACKGEYISTPMTLHELIKKESNLFNKINEDVGVEKDFKSIIFLSDIFIAYRLKSYLSGLIENTSFIIVNDCVDFQSHLNDCDFQSIILDSEKLQSLLKIKNISEHKDIHKIIVLNNEDEVNKYCVEQDKVTFLDFENTLSATSKKVANILAIPVEHTVNLSVLSHQEKIVIEYLMKGATNKYISAKMMLSEKTISSYKKRALSKLNVSSIVELCKHFY